MSYRGKFRPKNPAKYKGDPTKIIYRSSWEFKFFQIIDSHPDIIWWQSEELGILYKQPLDNIKMHRYFPDVILKKKISDTEFIIEMIEIKPKGQTVIPDIGKKNNTPSGRISRRYLNEVNTYGINQAKWEAAEKYCKERGWIFRIMTEDHLFGKGK